MRRTCGHRVSWTQTGCHARFAATQSIPRRHAHSRPRSIQLPEANSVRLRPIGRELLSTQAARDDKAAGNRIAAAIFRSPVFSIRPAYRAESGGFGPHSGAKLLLTRTAGATETSETWGVSWTKSNVWAEPAVVARDKQRHGHKRHADPQTVARTGVSTKKAQAIYLGLFR
jgi:hypothetical protein